MSRSDPRARATLKIVMRAVRDDQTRGGGQPADVSSVGVAAHELKSPLVLLRQLSLDLLDDTLSLNDRQQVLDQLVHISEKALRLTGNITRAEAVQSTLFPLEPINPLTICDDVTHELARLYQAHQRTLLTGRVKHIAPVVGNRDLLRRILLNFADNALYYGDENGHVKLEAQLIKRRGVVRVGVRDYGPALPRASWRRLVADLEHTHPVQARPQSSGLGIYIANQFAAAMNGRIGAIRHRDGTSFYVELPVSNQLTLL